MRKNLLHLPGLALQIGRTEGPRWMMYRARYATRRRLGLVQRQLPADAWDARPFAALLDMPSLADPAAYLAYRRTNAPRFFFDPETRPATAPMFARWDGDQPMVVHEADEIVAGTVRLFAHQSVSTGQMPNWHANPLTGVPAPANRHWSRINDFAHGDIKAIWDISRFGFAWPLVRAYWRTGDERYPERFWEMLDHWLEHNPPQIGPNWKCGQETSLRVMAWSFGLYGFLHATSTTPERVARLGRAMALFGERIEANVEYSLSQRNNHGMSEAMGLWTIGTLFPELRHAGRWRAKGMRYLERQADTLIYDDGAFAQHSMNYHRLMLDLYLWVVRLADIHQIPISDALRQKVALAGDFLFQLQDDETGRLPCYGQNDGSLILRLASCDYQDFRPVIQAIRFLTTGSRPYGDGPWDEELLWLFGPTATNATTAAPIRVDQVGGHGGYHTLRSSSGFAMLRCATFDHRPGEADMLHVDLWWRGQNVATDAGTFSYNRTAPWADQFNVLSHTTYHNTVTVDDASQMTRATPFLWLPWLSGQLRDQQHAPDGFFALVEGEHDGYSHLDDPVTHRRALVRLGDEHWLVIDDLAGQRPHDYRLHWLLPDVPYRLTGEGSPEGAAAVTLDTDEGPYRVCLGAQSGPADVSLVRADDGTPRGWRSPYYMDRDPALSVAMVHRAPAVRFLTLFGPGAELSWSGNVVHCAAAGWRATAHLADDRTAAPLVSLIAYDNIDVPQAVAADCVSTPERLVVQGAR